MQPFQQLSVIRHRMTMLWWFGKMNINEWLIEYSLSIHSLVHKQYPYFSLEYTKNTYLMLSRVVFRKCEKCSDANSIMPPTSNVLLLDKSP